MSDTREQMEKLRHEWLDLWYAIFTALGIIALTKRLGMRPRQWVRDLDDRRTPR